MPEKLSRWCVHCSHLTHHFRDLEITSAGLEEAFLALTQDNGENANRKN